MNRDLWVCRSRLVLVLVLLVAPTSKSIALSTERVASGLNRPIYVSAPDGDDRVFIVEQRGVIKILKDGVVLATPFLDIDNLVSEISGQDERGLLGLAFHPEYSVNGEFYVDYTNNSSNTVIARYHVSADPDVADPASAEILMTIAQPFANHNGGTILFGPNDGYLYIGMGDGGSGGDPGNRAQDGGSLLGKLLRIDVDGSFPYEIPPDNPFVGAGEPFDEIWAMGLRNPYRWSFDRLTGDLYIADVGQSSWEEIDFEPAASPGGRNYGWRLMEGNHCYNPPTDCNDGSLVLPIHEYSHGGSPFRCSVTGGSIYRGSAIPSLHGTYFFADWCSNQVWSFRFDGVSIDELTDRTTELAPGGGLSISEIAAIGEDGFGELYIVERGGTSSGEIYKILPDPAGTHEGESVSQIGLRPGRPNPFVDSVRLDFSVHPGLDYELLILDVSGRRVRSLDVGTGRAGIQSRVWDGLDEAGKPAPGGIYFVRLRSGHTRVIRMIHRLR